MSRCDEAELGAWLRGEEPAAPPAGSGGEPLARILDDLVPAQAAAAAADGPVLVLAGAGTGKTTVLTRSVGHSIAVGRVDPSRIMVVTFTNKAAAEARTRVQAMLRGSGLAAPSWMGTFHALGLRQLRAEPEVAGLRAGFTVIDADDAKRMIRRVLRTLGGDEDRDEGTEAGGDAGEAASLKAACTRVRRLKENLVAPEEAIARTAAAIAKAGAARRDLDAGGLRLAARVYVEYQRRLREANAADFDDLILWPVRAMRASERYRKRWAAQFDRILADEYQDVAHANYLRLRLLAMDHEQFFAVGDDDQAIMTFRGAQIEYIRRFQEDFPSAQVFRLEENFRSDGHVLDCANAIVRKVPDRLADKQLTTRKGKGAPVEVVAFPTAEAEAVGIAAEMRRRHAAADVAWADMMLLYRSGFQSRGYEEALLRARVPYVVVGDVGFWQRSAVKDALAYLRLAEAPDALQSDEAFRRVCNVPARGVGDRRLAEIERAAAGRGVSLLAAAESPPFRGKAAAALRLFARAIRAAAAAETTLADRLSMLLDRTGYRAALRASEAEDAHERHETVQELLEIAGAFGSARDLLDHAALAASSPADERGGRVRLMTMHKAKGLECPHVFLPGWESGVFPSAYGPPAEERRLAYVAVTRGRQRVTITHAEHRRGKAVPSPFLDDLPRGAHVRGWLHAQTGDARRRGERPRPDGDHAEDALALGQA